MVKGDVLFYSRNRYYIIPTYKKGRKCKFEKCETIISIYNNSAYCFVHKCKILQGGVELVCKECGCTFINNRVHRSGSSKLYCDKCIRKRASESQLKSYYKRKVRIDADSSYV